MSNLDVLSVEQKRIFDKVTRWFKTILVLSLLLVAVDGAGGVITPSSALAFAPPHLSPALQPPIPALTAPGNGAGLPCPAAGRVDVPLQWGMPGGSSVSSYEIDLTQLFDYMAGGSFAPLNDVIAVSGANPSYVLTSGCGASYRWRVRAVTSGGVPGGWSEARLLAIAIPDKVASSSPTAIAAPALQEPANNSEIACFRNNPLNFNLNWGPVSAAAGYELELFRSHGGTTTLRVDNSPFTLQDPCGNTSKYRWRVRALANSGTPGIWSEERLFTVSVFMAGPEASLQPVPVKPDAGASFSCAPGEMLDVAFRWSPIDDPFGQYEIELARLAGDEVVNTANAFVDGDQTEATLPVACGAAYRWRMRVADDVGNAGPWTETRPFSLVPDAPGPPPPDLAQLGDTTEFYCPPAGQIELGFRWSPAGDPASIARYDLELAKLPDPAFGMADPGQSAVTLLLPVDGQQQQTLFTDACASDMIYRWRMRAIDHAGNVGRWSAERQFSVLAAALDPPSPVDPDDGAAYACEAGQTRPIRLHWNPLDNPFVQHYEAWLTNLGSGATDSQTVDGTQIEASFLAACGAGYRWQVRAIDSAGRVGDWSWPQEFQLAAGQPSPPRPTLADPPVGVALPCPANRWVDVTLVWNPVSGRYMEGGGYELEETSFAGAEALPYTQIHSVGGTRTDITMSRQCGRLIQWRVRAIDGLGTTGPWSEPGALRLLALSSQDDPAPPPAPALIAPGVANLNSPASLSACDIQTFEWESVFDPNGIFGYTVHLQRFNNSDQKWEPLDRNFTKETATNMFTDPGERYRWRVVAVDNAGNNAPSTWNYFNCAAAGSDDTIRPILPILPLITPALEFEMQRGILQLDPSLLQALLPQLDLAVAQFTGPRNARRGQSLGGQVSLSITNNGNAQAQDFFIDLLISSDPTIDTTDQLLIGGREHVDVIAPGETLNIPLATNQIPVDWPPGSFYIGVFVDPFNHQNEIDEDNNTAFFPITVTP